jgi:hypothetical protein
MSLDSVSLLTRLQRQAGNQAVQLLIQASTATPGLTIQRYSVPADLECTDVVPWLDSNSPFAPEWAETRCTYTFNGQARVAITTLADGTVQMRARGHRGMSVSVSCPIDRPSWSPSRRPNRAAEVTAWQAMRAALDAHEAAHRGIGQTWRATIEGRWRGVDITVTGADNADARANLVAALEAEKEQWRAESQAAQDAIDPFRGATLDCP